MTLPPNLLNAITILLIVTYTFVLLGITLYAFHLFRLTLSVKKLSPTPKPKQPNQWPYVTVQLPLYNEKYVVERLIKCIDQFEYPKEKIQIQILDDSTDETTSIIQKLLKSGMLKHEYTHITRTNRKGFKAGALKEATKLAKGEYLAIFDADFLPEKDFLLKTIPHFTNNKIALVQTRWGHLNRNSSMLTESQAIAIDVHFFIEHRGRKEKNVFINFNGTAGIWRKKAIEDAGGWSYDTITEDLDLSYRAQVKKWDLKYVHEIESPAELPPFFSTLRAQQFRWVKGGAEVARKLLPNIYSNKNLSFKIKSHAFAHLLSSSVFLLIFLNALLSAPLIYLKSYSPIVQSFIPVLSVFLINFMLIGWVYYWPYKKQGLGNVLQFIIAFPIFLSLSMGLSLHNSVAVIEGLAGKKSPFMRTPKFNTLSKDWDANAYLFKSVKPIHFIEFFFGLVFLGCFILDIYLLETSMLLYHAMLFFGFTTMGCSPIIDYYLSKRSS